MTVMIGLLRGVNVGGHGKIAMSELRDICLSLKLRNPATYIQSGNVVFGVTETELTKLTGRIESAIEARCGFRPCVMLRTAKEMRDIVQCNPFAGRPAIEPAKLAVSFLATPLTPDLSRRIEDIHVGAEEIHCAKRELYIYFSDGQGRSKLPAVLERTLNIPATARNWNTVLKLLAMTTEVEALG
ncbi:MAG TPA: DUF1697 domain-containing protein [Candidatus Bathyarchaeia archaeon]|nr:DUF1697 domain-containing protein [Candidatus Bathyarchaeia archaeon]